jgi:transcriptional regulator with XRE-family HTH domain
MRDNQTPEQQAGAQVKHWRVARGLSQEEVAAEMRRLGHPWYQTTVVKTEAARRPIRLNEVVDLAAVLSVGIPDLVSPNTDELVAIQARLTAAAGYVNQLKLEVRELNRQLEVKTQALGEARKRVTELQIEYARADG